jgi:uncharacterized protein DUF1552
MSKNFNRRVLLRGLGGAVVAAPFLSSVAERAAKTQGLPPPSAPKRLIVLFTHYGCLTTRFFPAKSHGPLSKSDYMAMSTLAPMAPYADKLLMVRGIRAMNEWSFSGVLGQMNDPHTQVCGSYFSCHPVTPNAPESAAVNIGKFDAKPTGRTLDHVCAEQVNPSGVPPLLIQIGGLSGSNSNTQSVISYDQPEQIFPGYGAPLPLFAKLTGLFGPGPISPDTYLAARRRGVIDCVREDLNNLMRVDMSRSDRKKLSDWAELLDQTGKIVTTQCNADTATKLGLTQELIGAATPPGTLSDLSKISPIMMDLAVLAATCDASRVIFMKMPPSYVFRFLGLNSDMGSLSHRVGSASMGGTCIANALDMIHTADKWYAQQFAYLVGRLDSMTEGDRTMLDNSATVWFQEMSDGNAHNLNNLPILQAGSCGGYFKTGWAVNVEGGKADMTPGHSDDDCQNGQSPFASLDLLGTPPDVATQPINKYYCNLMNAIGVKAGPDGHPLKGGTEPVTRYGKYDDTTLFRTDAPAIIKDPGEYAALRAS